jgi:hypothetical protein
LSESAIFLFPREYTEPIVVDTFNLTTPFFLYEPESNRIINIAVGSEVNYSIWVFPRSLCGGKVSVFSASDNARYRIYYDISEPKRCIFTSNPKTNISFDYFAIPEEGRVRLPALSVYNDSIKPIRTTPPEISKMGVNFRVFFVTHSINPHTRWALNLNYTKDESTNQTDYVFDASRNYNGANWTDGSDSGIEYKCTVGVPAGHTLWM